MAKCPQCEDTVGEAAEFCSSCGAKLEAVKTSDLDKTNIEIEETRHRQKMAVAFTFLGMVVIGVGTWLGFAFTETKMKPQGLFQQEIMKYHPYANQALLIVALGCIAALGGLGIVIYCESKLSRLMKKLKGLR